MVAEGMRRLRPVYDEPRPDKTMTKKSLYTENGNTKNGPHSSWRKECMNRKRNEIPKRCVVRKGSQEQSRSWQIVSPSPLYTSLASKEMEEQVFHCLGLKSLSKQRDTRRSDLRTMKLHVMDGWALWGDLEDQTGRCKSVQDSTNRAGICR
jgi:hypothetical protein